MRENLIIMLVGCTECGHQLSIYTANEKNLPEPCVCEKCKTCKGKNIILNTSTAR